MDENFDGTLSFYSVDDGEFKRLGDFCCDSFEIDPMSDDIYPEATASFSPLSFDTLYDGISINATTYNNDDFIQILEWDKQYKKEPWSIISTCYVQNKHHKKRRISKKWARRYGYHEEQYEIGSCNYIDINGETMEFTLENIEMDGILPKYAVDTIPQVKQKRLRRDYHLRKRLREERHHGNG